MSLSISLYESAMLRAIQLARLAAGKVSPNPMVGAVLLSADGLVMSEGFHQEFGGAHAEVNALKNIPTDTDLSKCTLVVSLEPCSHFGKTPPCASLLIERGIGRVVVGTVDPNPLVAGRGIRLLQDAGIEVVCGICEQECRELIRHFYHQQLTKRPFVYLKWAQYSDGFMAPLTNEPYWISDAAFAQQVHKQRAEVDAVLIGFRTALLDRPSLTTRHWQGRNVPFAIVFDWEVALAYQELPFASQIERIIVVNERKEGLEGKYVFFKIDREQSDWLVKLLEGFTALGIQSLVVEGGAATLELFIEMGLWQEAWVYKSALPLGKAGVKAPELNETGVIRFF